MNWPISILWSIPITVSISITFFPPGPITKTQEELAKAIEETRFFIPDARYSMFNQKFNHLDGINKGLEVAKKVIK